MNDVVGLNSILVKLARKYSWACKAGGMDEDDLVQFCYLHCSERIKHYDSSRGALPKFVKAICDRALREYVLKYAGTVTKPRQLDLISDETKALAKHTWVKKVVLESADVFEFICAEYEPNNTPDLDDSRQLEWLRQAMRRLPKKWAEAALAEHGEKDDIAKREGVSRQAVDHRRVRALRTLKEMAAHHGVV